MLEFILTETDAVEVRDASYNYLGDIDKDAKGVWKFYPACWRGEPGEAAAKLIKSHIDYLNEEVG